MKLTWFFRELEAASLGSACKIHGSGLISPLTSQLLTRDTVETLYKTLKNWHYCPELYKAIEAISFIADHTQREDDSNKVNFLIFIKNKSSKFNI